MNRILPFPITHHVRYIQVPAYDAGSDRSTRHPKDPTHDRRNPTARSTPPWW